MKKLFYFIFFAAVITGATLTSVYGATLSNTLVSPTAPLSAAPSQFVYSFTTQNNNSKIKYIDIYMPANTTITASVLVASQNIPSNTTVTTTYSAKLPNTNPFVMLTLNPPTKIQNKNIVLFMTKFTNPPPVSAGNGAQTVTFTTKDSTNSTIDTGTAIYYPRIYMTPSVTDTGSYSVWPGGYTSVAGNYGIGTTGNPVQRLEVNGTAQIDGNVTASVKSNHEFKITATFGTSGAPICIGNC